MIEVNVEAYRTVTKFDTLDAAQARLEELKEKNPQHDYKILYNTRQYYRNFTLVRYETRKVHVLEDGKDFTLPPTPKYGDYADKQQFHKDHDGWESLRKQLRGDPEAFAAQGLTK